MQFKELKSPEEVLIEGQEVVEVISSKRFASLIKKQTKLMQEALEDPEAGFDILRRIDKKTYHFLEKQNPSHRAVARGDSAYADKLETGKYFPLIDVHFHPGEKATTDPGVYSSRDYSPSSNDLEDSVNVIAVTEEEVGLSIKPITIIAIPSGQDEVKMLIVQPTDFAILDEDFSENYENDRVTFKNQKDTIDALSQYGFKAAYVTLTPDGLSKEDQMAVQSFGFTAKKFDDFNSIPDDLTDFSSEID